MLKIRPTSSIDRSPTPPLVVTDPIPLRALTALDRTVIALARAEGLASLRSQHRLSRLLFGRRPSAALADPRLEAMRRHVILIRHGRSASTTAEQLESAGCNGRQIVEIERLATAHPTRRTPTMLNRCAFPVATLLAGLSLAFLSGTANAQASSDTQQMDAPVSSDEQPDRTHFIVGMGALYAPAYQGADTYRPLPLPAIDVKWGSFFANLRNGIGMNIVDTRVVTAGASITYMPGYRSKDAPDGIGKLSIGAGARGFVSVTAAGLVATVGATKGVAGGNRGIVADATLSWPVAITPRLTLIPTVGTTWADAKYNNRYFGVNAEQSLASDLPGFRPGSGFKDASALLNVNYRLTDHVILGASGGVTTLLGKVKDSPIVFHKTQPSGFLSVAYRF